MICCFVLFLYACGSMGYGFDSGGDQAACGRPYRSGRIYQPPCDLEKQGFCTSAGRTYPWHAVKKFVRDNQGLMRRMYGDQRHGHVLRAELQDDVELWNTVDESSSPPRYSRYQHQEDLDNDLIPHDDMNREDTEARFLHDDVANEDVLNTKFVYSEEPTLSIKLAGLKTAPHFRPTTQSTPKTTSQMNSAEDLTETITEAMDINTTTDTTTDQTTSIRSNDVANDRLDEVASNPTTDRNNLFIEIETDNNEDKTETMLFQDVEDDVSKKKPINYNTRGVNACPVKEEVVAPFWANNTRGEILALLNMYPFEQYVHWEKCTFEHRQMYCREGCRCEQQYRLHRLLAYDPNNECRGIFSDWFRFPSCCVCKCYDLPLEFRVTSRSPRFRTDFPEK